MSSIPIATRAERHPHLRPLNMLRDLPAVADLIELCFSNTMDSEGQRYVQDMRRAGSDAGFLRWAARMAETTSLPLTGYVWEQDGSIVANTSLIPFRHRNRRLYLIANVAVHPEYRRRGIAHALTERALDHAWQRKVASTWLHVRDDNPGAIQLYQQLGFVERARRTSWMSRGDSAAIPPQTGVSLISRHPGHWPQQQEWLRRLYPDHLAWYRSWNFASLRPGLANWLYMLFLDVSVRQWSALRGDRLEATLSWSPAGREPHALWLAAGPGADPEAVTALLFQARRILGRHTSLGLDFPAGESTEAFEAGGFKPARTLIWMEARASGRATS
jgi:ribosomal protein S18 acetylase RimI-like enzyme